MCTLLCVCMCLLSYVRLHMQRVCVCGCFDAACLSDGEPFHVVHNEIRPTPCSLLSGLYLSHRLVQVISFLWRLVSARVRSEHERSVMSTREEETGRDGKEKSRNSEASVYQTPFDICTFLMLQYFRPVWLEIILFFQHCMLKYTGCVFSKLGQENKKLHITTNMAKHMLRLFFYVYKCVLCICIKSDFC